MIEGCLNEETEGGLTRSEASCVISLGSIFDFLRLNLGWKLAVFGQIDHFTMTVTEVLLDFLD